MSDCILAVADGDSFDTSFIEVPKTGSRRQKSENPRLRLRVITHYNSNSFNDIIRLSEKKFFFPGKLFFITFNYRVLRCTLFYSYTKNLLNNGVA